MKKNLVITAHDFGSATSFLPLIEEPILQRLFNVQIIFSGPCKPLLPKGKNTYFISEHEKQSIHALITNLNPDLLLTGISGEGYGIDEIAIKLCKGKIKTFSYQDFWGHVNFSLGVCADTIFVLDEFAKKHTSYHKNIKNIITVGSLKYDLYKKNNLKYFLNNDCKEKYSVFIGQPLWHFNSYKEVVQDFFNILKANEEKGYYLPHPAENHLSYLGIISKKSVYNSNNLQLKENFILNASHAVSVFSSMLSDINMIKDILSFQKPFLSFYMPSKEIESYFKKHSGEIEEIPIPGIKTINTTGQFQNFLTSSQYDQQGDLHSYKGAVEKIIKVLT